ncbi:MAG: formamidopyrimidine-DNA glycosylase [Planctomycetes bacterium]|nr:formamidopyrimidine-DNA glycosylase [Planctomycetota bacterium]
MPELPDIEAYLGALRPRVVDRLLERIRIKGPFLLRTVDPPVEAAEGARVLGVERIGKRIVLALEGDFFLVIHLMIAGRLLWKSGSVLPRGKIDLAAFEFAESGTLLLTEASPKKRASLHVVQGRGELAAMGRGGLDVLSAPGERFAAVMRAENRTLKRRLTDPRAFDGIGNAYSDEILHEARLSPIKLTHAMSDAEIAALHAAARDVLATWTERLKKRFATKFPGTGDITAFRPEFAVHGKYGQPCPVCGSPIQRIVHAENETNYCATCQTGGKVLADRSLSRLLKKDWPRTIEEWESELGA